MDSIDLLRQKIADYIETVAAEFEKLENTKAYISRSYWNQSVECEKQFTAHIVKSWEHTIESLEDRARHCSDLAMEPKIQQVQSQIESEMHSIISKLRDMRLDKENARHYEINRCQKCIEQIVDKFFRPQFSEGTSIPHDSASRTAETCRLAAILLSSEPHGERPPRSQKWEELESHLFSSLQAIDSDLAKQLGETEITPYELDRLSNRLTASIKPCCGDSTKGFLPFVRKAAAKSPAIISAAQVLKITAAVNEAVKTYFNLRYVEDAEAEAALKQVEDGFEDRIAL